MWINSYVSTITYPFDCSGSDDVVDTIVYQHNSGSSDGAWNSRRWSDVETQLPVVVLRVELVVGGMSIDRQRGRRK